jgi:hypothetical protein
MRKVISDLPILIMVAKRDLDEDRFATAMLQTFASKMTKSTAFELQKKSGNAATLAHTGYAARRKTDLPLACLRRSTKSKNAVEERASDRLKRASASICVKVICM